MFKLQPNPTFWVAVSIPVPGEKKDAVIELEFRHKTKTALDAFFKSTTEAKNEADSIGDIVKDWKEIDVEYSAENLALLLDNYPAAGRAIFSAYVNALIEGRQKN